MAQIIRTLLAAILCFLWNNAFSQEVPNTESFSEYLVGSGTYRSLVPSGRTLVGISACKAKSGSNNLDLSSTCSQKETARVDLSKIDVLAPNNGEDSYLCTTLSTVDGRYSAKARQGLNKELFGRVNLGLETQYKNELKNYYFPEFLVLIWNSQNCLRPERGMILPSYVERDPNTLHVSLDLGRSDARIWWGDNIDLPNGASDCIRDIQAIRTHSCFLPLPNKADKKNHLSVEITKRGRVEEILRYKIALP